MPRRSRPSATRVPKRTDRSVKPTPSPSASGRYRCSTSSNFSPNTPRLDLSAPPEPTTGRQRRAEDASVSRHAETEVLALVARGYTNREIAENATSSVPRRRASIEDLHWADTSTLDLVVFLAHNLDDRRARAARHLPRRRAVVRRSHAPTRRGRQALRSPRSWSSCGRSRPTRSRRCSPPASARSLVGLRSTEEIVARSRRQPLLRRGARRRGRRRARRPADRPARPAASARGATRPPDAEPAASGRGRRTRRRLPAAPRDRSSCPSTTCASHCAMRSSTASS